MNMKRCKGILITTHTHTRWGIGAHTLGALTPPPKNCGIEYLTNYFSRDHFILPLEKFFWARTVCGGCRLRLTWFFQLIAFYLYLIPVFYSCGNPGGFCQSETEARNWLLSQDPLLFDALSYTFTNHRPTIPGGLAICVVWGVLCTCCSLPCRFQRTSLYMMVLRTPTTVEIITTEKWTHFKLN